MRDPKRIPKIMKRIEAVWEKYPDLRFLQLLLNSFNDVPYYYEDEQFIEALEKWYKEKK